MSETASDADHAELRTLLGASLSPLGGVVNEAHAGWWAFFTGVPSAEVNLALVHENEEASLFAVLDAIRREGIPVLLMLAGAGTALGSKLPAPWQNVGSMPVMSIALDASSRLADSRVREATEADHEAVNQLLIDAYAMSLAEADSMTGPILSGTGDAMRLWILEADGEPVSTVVSGRVGASVSLWCMATPPAHARHGYARALLGAVLGWARDDGATIGLLGATEEGFPLYENTGWHTFEHWQLYLDSPSAESAH